MRFKKSNCRKKMVFSQPDVPALGEVANFGTDYFLSKIKFLAKCKRVFTTKFAILPNACYQQYFFYSAIVNLINFTSINFAGLFGSLTFTFSIVKFSLPKFSILFILSIGNELYFTVGIKETSSNLLLV